MSDRFFVLLWGALKQELPGFAAALGLFMVFFASPALAQVPGLENVVAKINEFNVWLVTIGGALSVTGFIRVCLALILGLGNAASAAVMLAGGLAIASAKPIVNFFIPAQ